MKAKTTKVAAINCADAAKRFNDYIDNYLKGKSKEELLQHIDDCRHCFERLEFETMLKFSIAECLKTAAAGPEDDSKSANDMLTKILNHAKH